MCDDSSHFQPEVSRRNFLRASGAMAGVMLLDSYRDLPARAASARSTFDGTTARSMAMHVHSSFSEQAGSMEAQLLQAQLNAVDVLWWTDHDHRMTALGYRNVVHFTSLTDETTDGAPWTWQRQTSGTLTPQSSGGIAPVGSPDDPIPGSSLSVAAQSTTTASASLRFNAATTKDFYNARANLYGQTWTIDVLPRSVGPDGYLEILLATSYHPARSGRPASTYSVSYRVGGTGSPGVPRATGTAGVVTLAAVPGQWNTVTITPCDDIAALWPDMNSHDFSSVGLTLGAVSNGGMASGNFDYLRFTRQYASGDIPLQTQRDIAAGYQSAFPSVAQRQGLEMSEFYPHVNWFGGVITLPTYEGVTEDTYPTFMAQQVSDVHAAGGLASYNHPYGAGGHGVLLPPATQDSNMRELGTALLTNRALGADILEVGYMKRGGADLAHHVGLWDILSRNAIMLTGNGANDDHSGLNWYGAAGTNNWDTMVWSAKNSEADLLHALVAGRSWTGTLHQRTTLDLLVDGTCPMGSASVSSVSRRRLRVFATGIPRNGRVRVLRGKVDYAGTADPVPRTSLVGSYGRWAFASGSVSLPVDTTTSCFVRVAVTDSTGVIVALSNPVWLLRKVPPTGIPQARAA